MILALKIVYLSRSMLPSKTANSVHVMKMCQALAINGHDVTLVACGFPKYSKEYIFDYYGVSNNFEINMLKGRGDKVTGLLLFLVNFFFHLKKNKLPDLFYGRDLFTLTIAKSMFKVPFYFEAHKPPTTFIHLLLIRSLIKNKNLLKMVVITNSLKEEYLKKFPALLDQKILVSPDGADIPDKTDRHKAIKDKGGKSVIGYVGHLYPGRGVEIIHALARKLPQYDFHIVGGTKKDIASWQNICHGLDNIHFKGFVPHKELYRYYRDIDIVLAPYQYRVSISGSAGDTSKWMSPLKIFEYMAFAKPIIASNLPVLKEVLIDGFNALMCTPDCIDEWVNAIKLLDRDKNLCAKIANNAFLCLKDNYTWEKRAARILETPQIIR